MREWVADPLPCSSRVALTASRKILAHLRAWLAQIIAVVLELAWAVLGLRHGYPST